MAIGMTFIIPRSYLSNMANPSVSIPDEMLEDFDKIIKVKEMYGELETTNRSPVLQELIADYIESNEEYLDTYEDMMDLRSGFGDDVDDEGNPNAPMMAD